VNLQEIYCQAWWSFHEMCFWMKYEIRESPLMTLIIAACILMLWRFLVPNPRYR